MTRGGDQDPSHRATPSFFFVVPQALAVILVAGPGPAHGQAASPVTLNLVSWSYGVEIVRDNSEKLQQRYPGVIVKYSDFSWATCHDAMVARFASKTHTAG